MKHTIDGYITYSKYSWQDAPTISFQTYEPTSAIHGYECVVVATHSFEVEVPDDFDPRELMIAALRKDKQDILAEAEAKANRVERRIQELLAIEYKG